MLPSKITEQLNSDLNRNIVDFNLFINKKIEKPSFLKNFELHDSFRCGIFNYEYNIIIKKEELFLKIIGFYNSYYGIIFDTSSKFIQVIPKTVTITKFETI